jgi:HSP20 family protein
MARNLMSPLRSGGLFERGFEPFFAMQREMNRLFDEIARGSDVPLTTQGNGGAATLLAPRMDVTETDNELRITAEMPGVAANDVEVRLDDNMLTIRGDKRFEARAERENAHFTERMYGTFQRSLRLPFTIKPEQVQANFENGVLIVTLPKPKEHQKQSQLISVRSKEGQKGAQVTGGTEQSSPTQGSSQGAPDG